MKKCIAFVLVLILGFVSVLAAQKPAEKKVEKKPVFATAAFDGQAAWTYIRDLSADSMMGRESGTPGGEQAAEWIAAKFKEWGVEPAGADGSYFQNFTLSYFGIQPGVHFEIINQKERRSFHYGSGWRILEFSGSGNFVAPIVFAGYGIRAPEKGYDDYAGLDVKGKLVLFAWDSPRKLGEKLKAESELKARLRAARELGACGVLLFTNETQTQSRYARGPRLDKDSFDKDFVMLSAESDLVEMIFKFLPTEARYAMEKIENDGQPASFDTGVRAFVAVRTVFDDKRPTRNVIGKVTGSDSVLKDEVIVIGGHMDHNGIDPYGEVLNGADDNASGTAAVMELARIMRLKNIRPKRTVIFAAWAGEEQGLLGSKHYTENPLFPLERTVANINLDMVSEGNGTLNFMGRYYGPEVWEALQAKLPKELMADVTAGRGGPGGSDHTQFLMNGVPAFFLITEGPHYHYHQAHDVAELARPEILKKVGDLVGASIEILGNAQGDFFPAMRKETYYFRNQTVVNYSAEPLSAVLEKHKEAKDADVDIQLAVLEDKGSLNDEALFLDMLSQLGNAKDTARKSKGLALFDTTSQVSMDSRQGKTTIIPGLKSSAVFKANTLWAGVLAKQGAGFLMLDKPAFLFAEAGMSEEGKKVLEAANAAGLLLMVKTGTDAQAKALLEAGTKPLVLVAAELPGQEILDLIKNKKSALSLILNKEDDPAAFFKKVEEAKKAVGLESLMVMNEDCLWGRAGRDATLKFIAELLKAKWESADMTNVFSGTFLRVLGAVRGEQARPPMMRPF